MTKVSITAIFWVVTSFAALVLSATLIGLMLWATQAGWITGPNGPFVRFAISIALGLSVAALTVGGLRAYALLRGRVLGINVQVGGALAAVAVTVAGATYVTAQRGFPQPVYFIDARTKRPIEAETVTAVLQLRGGPREVPVGPDGYVEFKDLPVEVFNTTQPLLIKSSRYSLDNGRIPVRLTGEEIRLSLLGNDPIMQEFKKRLHLSILGLYAPLRVLAGNAFGNRDEVHVANFERPEVMQALVTTDLRTDPGKMTPLLLSRMFVYLSEEPTWKRELLSATGTHHDRLARAALRFSDYYSDLSMTDRKYLSNEELECLHRLRNTMFVERMKNEVGIPLGQNVDRIPEHELRSLFEAMRGVEDKLGPLNLYLVTF